jgi:hydrogenase 3 maturation protease
VCVLAVGSPLRGDDAAGLLVARHLRELLDPSESPPASGGTLKPAVGLGVSQDHDPRDHEPAQISHHAHRTTAGEIQLTIILGETAPENFTGEIKRLAPSHVVLVDAADFGRAPGEIDLLDPADADNPSMSTHALPVRVMIDYLRRFIDCRFLILGIQPAVRGFGKPVTPAIAKAAGELARSLLDAL